MSNVPAKKSKLLHIAKLFMAANKWAVGISKVGSHLCSHPNEHWRDDLPTLHVRQCIFQAPGLGAIVT